MMMMMTMMMTMTTMMMVMVLACGSAVRVKGVDVCKTFRRLSQHGQRLHVTAEDDGEGAASKSSRRQRKPKSV